MPGVDRVIGIGSPYGDDVAGWRVVEMLARREDVTAECIAIGAGQLLDYLHGCQRAILIDACLSAQAPGTITQLRWPDPRIGEQHRRSTHTLSVGDMLSLAQELGRLPPQVVLFGVEISGCRPGTELSPEVEGALAELEQRVLEELTNASENSMS
jgi:hydrogenase maturation protease